MHSRVDRAVASMLTPHLLFVLEQVTVDAFGDIVGAEHCEPSSIYIAAIVDQGNNISTRFGTWVLTR